MESKSIGRRFSWSSALIGAASAAATAALIVGKPRDPSFHLISISLSSLKLNLPLLDVELLLTVHVSNPNFVPISYSSSSLSIFYDGSLLGSAPVEAGSQPPHSCQVLRLPARLDGVELLSHHTARFLSDVANREMALDAAVDISGTATLFWWRHGFKVHVDSHVLIDPILLEIIDQDNKSELDLIQFDGL